MKFHLLVQLAETMNRDLIENGEATTVRITTVHNQQTNFFFVLFLQVLM